MQISIPATTKGSDSFPSVRFQTVPVQARIGLTFKLRDDSDLAAAKRAIEAARKLLADHGATVTVEFGEPS